MSCVNRCGCPPVGLGSGSRTSCGLYRERFLNKCNQHYFLHPVWLHFSPKSNENHSILLGVLNECLCSLETWQDWEGFSGFQLGNFSAFCKALAVMLVQAVVLCRDKCAFVCGKGQIHKLVNFFVYRLAVTWLFFLFTVFIYFFLWRWEVLV